MNQNIDDLIEKYIYDLFSRTYPGWQKTKTAADHRKKTVREAIYGQK